jgi:molybdopterin/thiamine biosynthesis adenylyltransferase
MLRERDGRHGPIASRLTGLSPAAATGALIGREILLDWPVGIESTRAGRALVETTANLVVRFCPQVRLRPTTAFADDLAARLIAIDSSAEPYGLTRPNALLVHLGGGGRGDVTGSAEGWVAYVSGFGEEVPRLREADVVIGAHGAAALVASQVFVRALEPDPGVAGPSRWTAYSLFEYGQPVMSPPAISPPVIAATLLGGCGAVGQACVDVLVSSGARGRLPVIDHGLVDDPTNLNRSLLAVEHDLKDCTPKVDLAVRRTKGSLLAIEAIQRPLEEVVALIEAGAMPWPLVVLSALDNRPARWTLQSLWPDLVLEGATGETMVQIFRHAHADGTACLRCLHPDEGEARDYVSSMAEATGIGRERIAAALDGLSAIVTEHDVDAAVPAVRGLVRTHLGRDMCGMLANVERLLGDRPAPAQLSVAFSSYLAGTFLAGELVKAAAGVISPLPGRYQIDPIANLQPDALFSQTPSARCFCRARAGVVDRLRLELASRSIP